MSMDGTGTCVAYLCIARSIRVVPMAYWSFQPLDTLVEEGSCSGPLSWSGAQTTRVTVLGTLVETTS